MIKDNNNRLIELDALRGLAAVSVMLFHYLTKYTHNQAPLFSFSLGGLGVSLFFMISGFVIFMSLNKKSTLKTFIISRFTRLYPGYWSAVIITSLVLYFSDNFFDFDRFLANLTMLQYWLRFTNIDGVYWTLRVELTYYILMVFIVTIGMITKIHKTVFFWMSLQVGVYLLLNIEFENHSINFILLVIRSLLILDYAHLFIAGMMLFQIYNDNQKVKSYIILLLSVLVGSLVSDLTHLIAFILFIFLFLLIFSSNIKFLRLSVFTYIGTISYSLYLLHQIVGYKIMDMLYVLGFNFWSVITITIIIIFLLASLNWKIFEVYVSKFIRSFLTNKVNQ
ncbi:acyltransferase [Sulfurovum sp. TSL6]|uniref:acyltransferase family protein n=1 Tax=Sulfurovum sp. TSL6 TaxID=2826995 RepID=UPI001CC5B0C2|nr:acyltransferase [Sulfurovum sp. TSL6]GIU00529.1 acyltransferase [Sulfurovum sp. TSL6]